MLLIFFFVFAYTMGILHFAYTRLCKGYFSITGNKQQPNNSHLAIFPPCNLIVSDPLHELKTTDDLAQRISTALYVPVHICLIKTRRGISVIPD
jgi:hypothetical protein